jgi:hypothetical protein
MYGVLAMVIASGVMLALLFLLSSRVEEFLSLQSIGGNLMRDLSWQIIAVDFVVGVGLGIVASSIAIRRYLKV